MKALFVLYSNQ